MASFPKTANLSCIFLLIMLSMSRRVYATNILLTGETLGPNEQLGYEDNDVRLVMQFNCNLVLKNGFWNLLWESGTGCIIECFLCSVSLSDRGQLLLHFQGGNLKWATPYNKNSRVGKYVGVLHPVGEFVIYGPAIWSTSIALESVNFNNNEKASSKNSLKNGPTVNNVLLPNEQLYDGDKLSFNGYEFIFKDCELILKHNGTAGWYSKTHLYGDNCFATVEYNGELTIRDGDHKLIWTNDVSGKEGKYVLVMQQNGNVVIYGPKVWSTKDSKSSFIEMDTAEK